MEIATTGRTTKIAAISLVLLILATHITAQTLQFGHENDDSDWWSVFNMKADAKEYKPQHRLPATSNIRILGITLGDNESRDFSDVIARLGQATIALRSDASRGRHQICYISGSGSEKVHLIFEQGELDDSFYLFAGGGGLDWE